MAATKGTTVLEHCRVSPLPNAMAEKTLPLTFFDIVWLLYHPISRVLFYEFPHSTTYFTQIVVPNLKKSLSIALQHYSPLAGNIITPLNISSGSTQIRYRDGDYVSLTFAKCTNDFSSLSGDYVRTNDELLVLAPQLPSATTTNRNSDNTNLSSWGEIVSPVLAVQVTLFPNHGISVGFTNSHVVADGRTMFNFISAWALIAKELHEGDAYDDASLRLLEGSTSFELPFYDRNVIKDSKGLNELFRSQMEEIRSDTRHKSKGTEKSSKPQNSQSQTSKKVQATFIINQSNIQRLKNLVMTRFPTLAHVSSLTVVCAYVWTCVIKAHFTVGCRLEEAIQFTIPMDCRTKLDPSIPLTYFGNCIASCPVTAFSSQLLSKQGFFIAAKLIGEAIHMQRHNDKGGLLKGAEIWIAQLKQTFGVAGSPKLDYYRIDFGWGKPRKFDIVSERFWLSRCKDSEGMEIGLCFPKNEMDAFSSIFSKEIISLFEH